jgi:hypothetical protein
MGEWCGWGYADVWFQEGLKRRRDSRACSVPRATTYLLIRDEKVAAKEPQWMNRCGRCRDSKSCKYSVRWGNRLNQKQSSESRGRQEQGELHHQRLVCSK